jgi:hypothetical protein
MQKLRTSTRATLDFMIRERGKDETYEVFRERCYKKNKQGIITQRKETIKDGEDGEDED